MQVAQALRDRCQRFLAEQLPEHQLDVARAAGTLAAFNESDARPTEDMVVDQSTSAAAAGVSLASAIITYHYLIPQLRQAYAVTIYHCLIPQMRQAYASASTDALANADAESFSMYKSNRLAWYQHKA